MKRTLFLHIILLFAALTWAQTPIATTFPYECSFEDTEDLSAWNLNAHTEDLTLDEWMFGDGAHSEGKRSMYISSNKKSPRYGNQPNIVVSYLRYQFPKGGSYDITFDWKCVGDTTNARMYLMICPESKLSDPSNNNPYYLDRIVSTTSGIISPNVVQQACQQLGGTTDRFLCGSDQWHNTYLTYPFRVSSTAAQMPFAFVFIWVNDNRDENVSQLGICIDNLQIGTGQIRRPENVQVESLCADSALSVSWESGLNEFEVQYRKVGSNTWRRQDGIMNGVEGFARDGMKCSYILYNIKEGTYDVRVRGIAYDDAGVAIVSNYAYKNLALVYCPENHCVNFIDIHSPNVLCNYGYREGVSSHQGETPYSYVGCIDYGPDAEESRHTVHVDPTETDPRTDGELLTVPKGALASVRLGNWHAQYEAEAITYTITVDSANQGILIVNYAIVLQKPGEGCGDPEFKMEIFDENGDELEDLCGVPDFSYSDAVAQGWNQTKDGGVAWKDWTTVGINLMKFNGQTIKVRFTSIDCGAGGHYGYGYFTMDCASAHLETENCGNDSKIECYAPEGFAYAWYKGDPDAPGNQPFWFERELITDPGKQEYTCRVSFLDDPSCHFDVSTVSEPRFPVADFTYERLYGVYGDGREDPCSSRLKFTNHSHVMNKYDGKETHTKEPTNDTHWYFRRLSNGQITESYNPNPVYSCPAEGDSIEVTLWTYIGVEESPCDTTKVDTIVVPNIIPDSTEFHYTTCPESPIYFGGQWFNTDTVFVGEYPNFAGCDSTSTLYLKVWPIVEDTYRHDSICSDGSVTINGVKYNQPVENLFIRLKTTHDCDSGLYFTLTVNERLQAEVAQVPYACADDEVFYLTYDISAGKYDSLVISFSTPQLRDTVIYDPDVNVIAIPYPANITPGHYTAKLVFYQFCCGKHTEERSIDVRYRSSIVEQKWNDVLTLLAPKYNGGFEFTAFQWYKNNTPIEGATHSYLYQDLDFDADYYVVVTRPDGVSIATCPIRPVYHPQQSEYPTIIKVGQRMPMYMEQPATIWYYTMSGQLYGSFSLPQGYTTLEAPAQPGVYVIKSVNAQGETKAQKIIVE